MRITQDSYNNMNDLMAMCFDANAVIDNLAYCLDFYYYTNIADVVHHSVAHVMPEWADLISDKMLQLSARPVRKDINGYQTDYRDLKEIFSVLYNTLMGIHTATRRYIEAADLDGDDDVRIFLESFLEKVTCFIKQADEWNNAATILTPADMNIHIKDYTHFIDIV